MRKSEQQVLPNAFGNAFGESIKDSMMPQNSTQQNFRASV
jgi:hypothetical protein